MKLLTLLASLALAPAGSLFACTCAAPGPELSTRWAVAEFEVRTTPVIFQGKVDDIKVKGWPIRPVPGRTISATPDVLVRFSDVRFYRGTSATLVVETGLGAGDCGYRFKKGESYLVFAWTRDDGTLTTGICSATSPLDYADTELRLLKGEPATAKDLSDLHDEEKSLAPPAIDMPRICGKVDLPKGARSGDIEVYAWPADEESIPLQSDNVQPQPDGTFCTYYLDPGKYVVAAVQSIHSSFRLMAYYPGVADRSHATPVVVARGSPSNLQFPLIREPLHTVRGYVRGSPMRASDEVQVILLSSQLDTLTKIEPVLLAVNGGFDFPKVPAGHYSAFAVSFNEKDETLTFLSTVVECDVSDNVEGLVLEFVPVEPKF